ncbi:hypothetical protein [Blastococcus mobilis]|uniref:Uncharacterized protein n=1 Tax=Blastococcus mobilis TaxID=1938746 RepID=A0A239ASW7_9ACTN|nr:hypothetical protein [Blastococcus mobilis]SNR98619.1 hypothetical protein SAMN06272737_1566 [Blastococcus mobilis]
MADRKKTDPDALLKAYYQIMRELGPDPVLEERIEREEHRLEHAGTARTAR